MRAKVGVMLATVTLAAPAAAQAKPSLLPTPTGGRAGDTIALKADGFPAKPKFRLSTDARSGRGDRRLRARRRGGRWRVRIPRSTPYGTRFVVGCARRACASTPIAVLARPRPLSVDPVLESDSVSSGTIGPEGGDLFAFAPDGTAYTLTIPRNALAGPVAITMTPIRALGGAPLSGGFLGGVDLKPSGLRLVRPGTLRIEPPQEVSRSSLSAVAYSGGGGDFHFAPYGEDALTIPISGFSGHGAGTASAANYRQAAGRPPSAAEQQMAAAAADARRRAKNSQQYEDAIAAALDALFYADVLPRLENAEHDDALILDAIRSGIDWVKMANLVLGSPGLPGDIFEGNGFALERDYLSNQVVHLLLVAQQRALVRCGKELDPVHIQRYIAWNRQYHLINATQADLNQLGATLAPCARFELDAEAAFVDMEVSETASGGRVFLDATGGVEKLLLTAPTDASFFSSGAEGSRHAAFKPLVYTHPGCSVLSATARPGPTRFQGSVQVIGTQLDENLEKRANARGMLLLGPGDPIETVSYQCPGEEPSEEQFRAWANYWPLATYLNAKFPTSGPNGEQLFAFDMDLAPGGQAFAKTWTSRPEGNPSTNPEFKGTIRAVVRHAPDPALANGSTRVRDGSRLAKHQARILRMLRVYAERRRKAGRP